MWTVEDNTTGRHDPMAHFADSWWMHPDLLFTVASISVGKQGPCVWLLV